MSQSVGQNNGTGTARELFERKAATDVLKYFKVTNVVRPLVTNDSIESGKAKAFPVVGNATTRSRAETSIAEVNLDQISSTERVINIGQLVSAHAWISDLDQAMVHYDAKSAQIESIGRALAKKVDEDLIAQLIVAGEITDDTQAQAAGLKSFAGEDVYTSPVYTAANYADSSITGANVRAFMGSAMTEFRDKDAIGDPVFLLRPNAYFALLSNADQLGLTWVNDPYAQSGKVPMVLGAKVVYSPHFPALSTTIGDHNVIGMLFSKEAAGILELLSVNIRTDYIPQRMSHLMTGKMAVGYGVLNHACCVPFGYTQQS
jgi:hypothetical protein